MILPGDGGGHICPPLISISTYSILMTIYSTLYKNCSRYIFVNCFIIGLGLAEIKVVFLLIIGDCAVAMTISIKCVISMSSENCCA